MFLVVQAHQRHPQQRTVFQVELSARFVLTDLSGASFTGVGGQVAKVDALQFEAGLGLDPLQGLAVAFEEPCAQGFVAVDQLLEAAAQRRFIQLAAQAQGTGNRIGAALRVQLPEKPQAVLGQGLR